LDMLEQILIFTNLSLLVMHEMDAIHCKEWKIFIFFENISDRKGYLIFSILHFPLFIAILFLTKYQFEIMFWILNIFLVFHSILHLFFRNHKFNHFQSKYSIFLITAMGLIGIIAIIIKIFINI